MDPVKLTIAALTAGATGSAESSASTALGDAYRRLKRLVAARFNGNRTAEAALTEYEANSEAWRASMEKALKDTGADTDPAVIDAAQRLMTLHGNAGSIVGKYLLTRGRRGTGRPVTPEPVATPVLRQRGTGRPVTPKPGVPDRVILIERSSGIQVGRDNDQYSAYRVKLPTAALRSGQALADRLLSSDAPWSRDVFSHDARPDLGGVSNRFGVATSGIVAGPRGDTLVIVRNSRGVQVGDHNAQRNQFRVRVADVTIQANRLGATSARNAAISRLRDDPGDRAAARSLAEDVARAASRDLVVDLRAQVTREVGHPQINRWSGEFHNLTGRQVGGPNRAHVAVHVTVSRLESRALARQILESARRRAPHAARQDQPSATPIRDVDRIHRSGPTRLPGSGGGRGFR